MQWWRRLLVLLLLSSQFHGPLLWLAMMKKILGLLLRALQLWFGKLCLQKNDIYLVQIFVLSVWLNISCSGWSDERRRSTSTTESWFGRRTLAPANMCGKTAKLSRWGEGTPAPLKSVRVNWVKLSRYFRTAYERKNRFLELSRNQVCNRAGHVP